MAITVTHLATTSGSNTKTLSWTNLAWNQGDLILVFVHTNGLALNTTALTISGGDIDWQIDERLTPNDQALCSWWGYANSTQSGQTITVTLTANTTNHMIGSVLKATGNFFGSPFDDHQLSDKHRSSNATSYSNLYTSSSSGAAILCQYRGSATIPTLPSGYTNLTSAQTSAISTRISYKTYSSALNNDSATWSNSCPFKLITIWERPSSTYTPPTLTILGTRQISVANSAVATFSNISWNQGDVLVASTRAGSNNVNIRPTLTISGGTGLTWTEQLISTPVSSAINKTWWAYAPSSQSNQTITITASTVGYTVLNISILAKLAGNFSSSPIDSNANAAKVANPSSSQNYYTGVYTNASAGLKYLFTPGTVGTVWVPPRIPLGFRTKAVTPAISNHSCIVSTEPFYQALNNEGKTSEIAGNPGAWNQHIICFVETVQTAVEQTLFRLSMAATGAVVSGADSNVTQTLPGITQDVQGDVSPIAITTQTLPTLIQAVTCTLTIDGSIDQSLTQLYQELAATAEIPSSILQTLPVFYQAAEGQIVTTSSVHTSLFRLIINAIVSFFKKKLDWWWWGWW